MSIELPARLASIADQAILDQAIVPNSRSGATNLPN